MRELVPHHQNVFALTLYPCPWVRAGMNHSEARIDAVKALEIAFGKLADGDSEIDRLGRGPEQVAGVRAAQVIAAGGNHIQMRVSQARSPPDQIGRAHV